MGDGTIEERRHGPYHSAAGSNRTTHVQAFYQHKDLLFSIAYRMLGTVADAEDMLQETFIRWQSTPTVEIQSPRSFLVTVLSRLCLQQLDLHGRSAKSTSAHGCRNRSSREVGRSL